MKKNYILRLIISIPVIGLAFISCSNEGNNLNSNVKKSEFVTIKENKFYCDNKEFYPLVINYKADLISDGNSYWIGPHAAYYKNKEAISYNRDSCLMYIKNDFKWIKELGYNAIRLVGSPTEPAIDYSNGSVYYYATGKDNKSYNLFLDDSKIMLLYQAIDEIISIADQNDLKLILLTPINTKYNKTEACFEKFATHYKDRPAIMAYDLYNEPLYFDTLLREKKEVYEIVKHWQDIKNKYAPNQLSTIGMTGVREVLEWDPNLMSVDFLSFHPYEYEPNQVLSEIYWYGKYVKIPWMIGETGVPADDDSVKYNIQTLFAEKTLLQTFNCGGLGYSWWQFKDVQWLDFHQDYLCVINQNGITKLKDQTIVEGTAKPMNAVIETFNPSKVTRDCYLPENYYNYSRHKYFKLTGKIADESGKPIEGGIILGWSEDWRFSYHTVSKSDGSFELFSNFPLFHWRLSATMYDRLSGDIVPDLNQKDKQGTINTSIGVLTLKKIEL